MRRARRFLSSISPVSTPALALALAATTGCASEAGPSVGAPAPGGSSRVSPAEPAVGGGTTEAIASCVRPCRVALVPEEIALDAEGRLVSLHPGAVSGYDRVELRDLQSDRSWEGTVKQDGSFTLDFARWLTSGTPLELRFEGLGETAVVRYTHPASPGPRTLADAIADGTATLEEPCGTLAVDRHHILLAPDRTEAWLLIREGAVPVPDVQAVRVTRLDREDRPEHEAPLDGAGTVELALPGFTRVAESGAASFGIDLLARDGRVLAQARFETGDAWHEPRRATDAGVVFHLPQPVEAPRSCLPEEACDVALVPDEIALRLGTRIRSRHAGAVSGYDRVRLTEVATGTRWETAVTDEGRFAIDVGRQLRAGDELELVFEGRGRTAVAHYRHPSARSQGRVTLGGLLEAGEATLEEPCRALSVDSDRVWLTPGDGGAIRFEPGAVSVPPAVVARVRHRDTGERAEGAFAADGSLTVTLPAFAGTEVDGRATFDITLLSPNDLVLAEATFDTGQSWTVSQPASRLGLVFHLP